MSTTTALQFPAIAAGITALLGLLAAFLTFRVIRQRVVFDVHAGDGGKPALAQAMRAHSNFAEHSPLALLLLALAQSSGAHRGLDPGARRPVDLRAGHQRSRTLRHAT